MNRERERRNNRLSESNCISKFQHMLRNEEPPKVKKMREGEGKIVNVVSKAC